MKYIYVFLLISFTLWDCGESSTPQEDNDAIAPLTDNEALVSANTFPNPISPSLHLSRRKREEVNDKLFRLHLDQFKEVKENLEKAETKIEELQESSQSMDSTIKEQQQEILSLKQSGNSMNSTIEQLHQQIQNLNGELTRTDSDLQIEIGKERTKIDALKELLTTSISEMSSNFETASNDRKALLEKIHDLRSFKSQTEQKHVTESEKKRQFAANLAALNKQYGTE